MSLSLELDYRLRWMDFDRYGRMQPKAMLDIFQDVATIHAIEMGIGRDDMVKHGVFWAVIRTKLEVLRDPVNYQVVTVRTWPHTPTRFSFLRDFYMSDKDGRLLVKATSEWVLMDIETRKFVSVADVYNGPTDFDEERAFERKPRKALSFEEGNRPVVTITPSYTDIDVNGHVNNAVYADFVINALNPSEEGSLKTMQIDYRYEAKPGEPLAVHTLVEEGCVRSKGLNEKGDIVFASEMTLF